MLEREMEDLLWNHPDKFFAEPLKPVLRQPSSEVGRADLVFEDRLGRLLVVELKRGKLQRGAIFQVVDYFGMMKGRFPGKAVEMMVVAHSIPPERRISLEQFNVNHREIPEKYFRDVASEVQYVFKSEMPSASTHISDNNNASRNQTSGEPIAKCGNELASDLVLPGDIAVVVYPDSIAQVRRQDRIVSYGRIAGRFAALVTSMDGKLCTLNFHYDKNRQEFLNFRFMGDAGWQEYWDNRTTRVEVSFLKWNGTEMPFEHGFLYKSQGGPTWLQRMIGAYSNYCVPR